MAKLKFDRSILINLDNDNKTQVPSDEVWKGTLIAGRDSSINYKTLDYDSPYTRGMHTNTILGGGYFAKRITFLRDCIQTSIVALAKEVTLA